MALDIDDIRRKYSAWVDVDLDELAWNYSYIVAKVAPAVLIPVIKANAMGFGVPIVGKALEAAGAKLLAVSNFNEALELRRNGGSTGILAMNGLLPVQMATAVEEDITFFVYDEPSLRAADECGRTLRKKAKVHIKIDSGLGRLGLMPSDAPSVRRIINQLDWIDVTGVASHLASPYLESDREFSFGQYRKFVEAASIVDPQHQAQWHLAASSGVIRYPEMYLDAVRSGCLLHGLSRVWPLPWELKRHATFRARVVQVKELPAGHNVGYRRQQRQYSVPGPTKVAILPCGTHDGLKGAHADSGWVLIHGTRCRVIGLASCMMMVDVSHLKSAEVGDEVVIFGKQGQEEITVADCAAQVGLAYGDITGGVARRIPRVYWKNGTCVAIDVSGFVLERD